MGKNKLKKFADMEQFSNVFQMGASSLLDGQTFSLKGKWSENYFGNNHPIVLELGCGKGEYTIGLSELFPEKNFIGIDIKGARIWTGAKDAFTRQLPNVAFLRTNIEMIHHFFAASEVSEIWLTFPDPQMKKTNKRLTSTYFLGLYRQILCNNGLIHLKTDSRFMFAYTCEVLKTNTLQIAVCTDDLYASDFQSPILNIKTHYEKQWLERGLTIKYLQFHLSNEKTLLEPQIEIERDGYKSYSRNQKPTE